MPSTDNRCRRVSLQMYSQCLTFKPDQFDRLQSKARSSQNRTMIKTRYSHRLLEIATKPIHLVINFKFRQDLMQNWYRPVHYYTENVIITTIDFCCRGCVYENFGCIYLRGICEYTTRRCHQWRESDDATFFLSKEEELGIFITWTDKRGAFLIVSVKLPIGMLRNQKLISDEETLLSGSRIC